MKLIKAVYNFIVGDMVILVGVIIALILLTLINSISALSSLRAASGYILLAAVLIVLTATLYREASGTR